jgi:hypothetical protein
MFENQLNMRYINRLSIQMIALLCMAISSCGNNKSRTESGETENFSANVEVRQLANLDWSSNDKGYWNSQTVRQIPVAPPASVVPLYADATPISSLSDLATRLSQRHYITNLGAISYNIMNLPGNIVKYDSTDNSYSLVTQVAILKNHRTPQLQLIPEQDGVNYSSKFITQKSVSGSILFGSASFEKNTLLETSVQDFALAIAPDSIADLTTIENIKTRLASNPGTFYYVKSAMMTYSSYRNSITTKFNARISQTYVTLSGQTFASTANLTRLRLVSMDLINMKDIITTSPVEDVSKPGTTNKPDTGSKPPTKPLTQGTAPPKPAK